MARRKKHPRLPNGYGSIRYLGPNRRNPYAVHPPGDLNGDRPAALCYVPDWTTGFAVLTAWHAGTYTPGCELELARDPDTPRAAAQRIFSDYQKMFGKESGSGPTFADVYRAYYDDKFPEGHRYSHATIGAAEAAFKSCPRLHDLAFRSITAAELQDAVDSLDKSHAAKGHLLNLFRGMYKFAESRDLCDKRYDKFVRIKTADDTVHGVPFTDDELCELWENKEDDTVAVILMLCYSGWRITEFAQLSVDLDAETMTGGVKTAAGKNRVVPIHSAILPLVRRNMDRYGKVLPCSVQVFRKRMTRTLTRLGMGGDPPHTPHDCRHTFSRLCEMYGVRENDRKRMMGHSFGGDITNAVYGHRTVEELRTEVEKIRTL